MPWNHVIQIQVLAVKNRAAVLTPVLVALKNIMARELHFFLRKAVEQHQENHARDADAKRNGVNAFRMRFLLREVVPLVEVKGLE